ncbi:MAG TPA: glutamine amidotransferase [Candidatus Sulfotelmatobacter sp.]|nr:glutamine amidotransferase [Candidatus Sulfotelmatobacter sp.]
MSKIKPFLLLQLRPEKETSDNEREAFLRFSGLAPEELVSARIEQTGLPKVDLNDYSGVLIGGGPSNVSDNAAKKPDSQKKFEAQLRELLTQITEQDFPFLGACYGISILADFLGAEVAKGKYAEEVNSISLSLTDEGKKDKLTKGIISPFKAFTGHKESCQELPKGTTLLVTGEACPIQMIRFATNVYATQFHSELDSKGLEVRILAYRHLGYFPPEDAEKLIEMAKHETITEPEKILKNFVRLYSKPV